MSQRKRFVYALPKTTSVRRIRTSRDWRRCYVLVARRYAGIFWRVANQFTDAQRAQIENLVYAEATNSMMMALDEYRALFDALKPFRSPNNAIERSGYYGCTNAKRLLMAVTPYFGRMKGILDRYEAILQWVVAENRHPSLIEHYNQRNKS